MSFGKLGQFGCINENHFKGLGTYILDTNTLGFKEEALEGSLLEYLGECRNLMRFLDESFRPSFDRNVAIVRVIISSS